MNVIYNRYLQNHTLNARMGAVVFDGDWLHVGDVKGLEIANRYLASH